MLSIVFSAWFKDAIPTAKLFDVSNNPLQSFADENSPGQVINVEGVQDLGKRDRAILLPCLILLCEGKTTKVWYFPFK